MTDRKPAAERRLMNKAVHYLGRYTASQQRLREVLRRFAVRKLDSHDKAEVARAIEMVVDDCVRLGYVDDTAFALSKARSKRRGGCSALAIRRSLQEHAIDADLVDEVLAAADEDTSDGELVAALRHAARRRLGPYATRPGDETTRQRHLASLARAGFSLGIARQVLDLEDVDAAERLVGELHC
jgi:regulatory protein